MCASSELIYLLSAYSTVPPLQLCDHCHVAPWRSVSSSNPSSQFNRTNPAPRANNPILPFLLKLFILFRNLDGTIIKMERTNSGCTVKDVPAAEFVTTYAAHLKRVGLVEIPPWVDTIKTASRKELAPYDPDWLYIRIGKLL